MHHTINAGEGGPTTTVAMRIEFLLGKDVTARLVMNELDRESSNKRSGESMDPSKRGGGCIAGIRTMRRRWMGMVDRGAK